VPRENSAIRLRLQRLPNRLAENAHECANLMQRHSAVTGFAQPSVKRVGFESRNRARRIAVKAIYEGTPRAVRPDRILADLPSPNLLAHLNDSDTFGQKAIEGLVFVGGKDRRQTCRPPTDNSQLKILLLCGHHFPTT
jgi:hypothetical protein